NDIQLAGYKILNALWIIGTKGTQLVNREWIIEELNLHLPLLDVMTNISRTIRNLTSLIADIEEHTKSRVFILIYDIGGKWDQKKPQITNVTSNHMNSVLGSVLKLINNNIDAIEAPWMKRIADKILFSRDE
ncbi:unnamed protein product, partial [Rotaria sordida]